MKRLQPTRLLRILGFAVGGVAVAGAAVLVTASAAGVNVGFRPAAAQSAQASSTPVGDRANASAICNDFISHLSSDLGKSQSQLDSAVQKAIGETLADEIKNGHLTQSQADVIKARLASKPPCTIAGSLRPGGPGTARPPAGRYKNELLAAAASALGINETTLKADLAKGMTLSQIAAAQNPPVTEVQFRARLIAQLTPLLSAAVAHQQLSSAQEQMILQRLQAGPIPFWSTPLPRPKAAAPASAVATTTT